MYTLQIVYIASATFTIYLYSYIIITHKSE